MERLHHRGFWHRERAATITGVSKTEFDLIIVGGGLVGLTLGRALALSGLEVALVERADPQAHLAAGFDGRASAIASSVARMLRAIGLDEVLETKGCAIRAIRVADGLSPLSLHFDSEEADPAEPLGYMLENRNLRAGLLNLLADTQGFTMFAPAEIRQVERDDVSARVHLADGRTLVAPLVIAADGRRSSLREQAGIRLSHWRYDAVAFVSMLHHERTHDRVASEIFYSEGPLALLPMPDSEDGSYRSCVVWTVRAKQADGVRALSPRAFGAEIEKRCGGFLGRMDPIASVAGYPLNIQHAERYWAQRLLLVGDAAHGVHPIAGQGLNMGLRDVAAMTEVLVKAARTGQDLGHPDVARRHERWRRSDNAAVAIATDMLTHLFGIPGKPMATLRRLGLAAVNRMPPLRRGFMKAARGEAGDLPLLLRGELP